MAAYDLGASWWRAVVDIILPLIRPGIITAMVLAFLLSFNEYNRAFYLIGRQDTLPIYMLGRMSSGASPTIYALSGSILVASHLCMGVILISRCASAATRVDADPQKPPPALSSPHFLRDP